MEVHAHSHTERKKWTHYLWEFLMLFLAVFCGFLAENIREHKVEKNRERQYMQSLVEDLKADTASIAKTNGFRVARLRMYDSLSEAILSKKYMEKGSTVYFWGRNISRRTFFFSADGTMQQLKNSGGFRLINNKNIADKIMAYDVLYRTVMRQQDLEELQLGEYRQLAGKVFDASVFRAMTTLKDSIVIKGLEGNPQLKDDSPSLLNDFANKLNYWAVGSTFLLQMLEQLKEKAILLMKLIQNEYHLK
ncbi:MAG: hypothetical protein EPN92_06695 [Chitinophagaceae bacterium]|nr:MAG: hypothetical protein EPN92_06695 [Chitinophagaceae bacterium]